MAYEKQNFVDEQILHAYQLNYMEAGISQNAEDIFANTFAVSVLQTLDLTLDGEKLRLKNDFGVLENREGVALSEMINFTTDNTLTLGQDRVLSVNVVKDINDSAADKTLPISASAVEATIGNIGALLDII